MDFPELVTRSQSGDDRAFGELVERFEGMAFGYAYFLLGDFHLAQDATQEAFMEAYREVGAIRNPRGWPAWLRRVVFKHCDRIRRRRQLETVPLESGTRVYCDRPVAGDHLEREEMKAQLHGALGALTEEERAVAILTAIHGYRHREVAEFLEITSDAVKNRMRAARRKLSKQILMMTTKAIRDEAPNINAHVADIKTLHEACRNGDVGRVTNLLQKHPEVLDSPDRDTRFPYPESQLWSPLYLAAMNGHGGLVKLLLGMDANPVAYEVAAQYHEHTYTGWTNVLRERGYDAIAERIEGAIVGRYGRPLGETGLQEAIRAGEMNRVRALLDEHPDYVERADRVGNTALHWAVAAGHLEITRLLLERGAHVDSQNGDGRTPGVVALFGLHRYWRREEKPEILAELLQHGAQYTILIAAAVGDIERVRALLRKDPAQANELAPCYRRPLSAAADKGYTEIVRLLLEHGADPNAREAICQGGLALRSASSNGHVEVVRLLLDHGAVPQHWVDASGDAVFAAHHRGDTEILQLLYAHGGTTELQVYAAAHRIDVIAEVLHVQPSRADEVLPYGWDSADTAARGLPGSNEGLACDIMRLAIRYGARFENTSEWKLRWTVARYPRVFRLLQEHGANPDLPLLGITGDRKRRWPDPEHHLRTVAFLVEECGADVNCRDSEGFTPLANAARQGFLRIVEFLLSKGATRNCDAPEWAQPEHLARSRGHTEVVRALQRPPGD